MSWMKFSVVLILPALMACASHSAKSGDADPNAAEGCHTPLGFIPEGSTATGYLQPVATSGPCQQGTLSCKDGVWSGAYIYPSCTIAQ